ncbi:GMP reductase 2 isoform X3 [Globicephala melas]|uniref:GMP reductase n=1 Tax=Tursiops truncatus TaxID=9739 RepID=A0A6J3QYA7_TURTR|nr:GMP reductase 2 isoform X3 [Globicephala melas]XP_033707164.1 GMP reductase 2 isoform X2 [Tursiops truncatus]XP_059860768.1 GMP reductase 2 isoform X3 [Delphinus delphis]
MPGGSSARPTLGVIVPCPSDPAASSVCELCYPEGLQHRSWNSSVTRSLRQLAEPVSAAHKAQRGCARLVANQEELRSTATWPRRQEVPAMPHIDNDVKLDFKDVLLRPKRSTLKSRSEVDLTRSFSFRNSKQMYTGIPIIAANMDTVGTFEIAKVLCKFSLFTAVHKHYSLEQWKEFASQNPDCLEHLAASSGTSSADFEQLGQILDAIPQAGNVVTGEMVEELILSGADIIKVGIGPGSVCTTRKKTGVGYPQLSAVMECADAAHGLKGHIISDGGCNCPGDVAKAFGAGADFVMLGGMLAGHSESGGELIERDGKKYKLFYGMSSEMAMKKYAGGVAEYRASEGKTVEMPFKGDVEHTIRDILGGIRSTCTYVGAAKLKELSRRTTFIRVTQQVNPIFSDKS